MTPSRPKLLSLSTASELGPEMYELCTSNRQSKPSRQGNEGAETCYPGGYQNKMDRGVERTGETTLYSCLAGSDSPHEKGLH